MSSKCLAAISLDPHGGGVATASRLMWRAIQRQWPDDARLITLVDEQSPTMESTTIQRVQFGARLAKAQLLRECDWVFYSHIGVAQVQSYLPASSMQRPYGVFLHGIEVWLKLSRAQQRVLDEATLLVANSAFTAERVRANNPSIREITVCHLGLEAIPATEGTAPALADLGPHVVLIVGRMSSNERYKGHDELIAAWPEVLRRCPTAELVVVGSGDDEMRLKQKADAAGLNGSVRFVGFLNPGELPELYKRAAVFAMPSRNEGFGLVYIEAMAQGVPCIGSTEDAAREVIQDGQTGFLVAQSDTAMIADRVVRLLADQNLRREMGERARARVRQYFTADRFERQFTELLAARLENVAPVQGVSAS